SLYNILCKKLVLELMGVHRDTAIRCADGHPDRGADDDALVAVLPVGGQLLGVVDLPVLRRPTLHVRWRRRYAHGGGLVDGRARDGQPPSDPAARGDQVPLGATPANREGLADALLRRRASTPGTARGHALHHQEEGEPREDT